jgi:hypothetical protein
LTPYRVSHATWTDAKSCAATTSSYLLATLQVQAG